MPIVCGVRSQLMNHKLNVIRGRTNENSHYDKMIISLKNRHKGVMKVSYKCRWRFSSLVITGKDRHPKDKINAEINFFNSHGTTE